MRLADDGRPKGLPFFLWIERKNSMIGLWSESAQTFLLVLAISTTLVFALPIFLLPLAWARLMRWRIPQDIDLAVYFGRCLGAFILIVEALMLRAALTGEALHTTFEVL